MSIVELTYNKISTDEIVEKCTHPKGGAVTVFVGTTRDFYEDDTTRKDVVTLSYEADEELALNEMKNICDEAIQKYEGLKAVLVHRLGEVGVGEVSIVCAISTPHRKEGFKACEWMMHDLKKRVAVWKKEIYKEGDSEWKANKEFYEDNIPEKVNLI